MNNDLECAIAAQIFLSIQDRLATKVTELKFIDQDLGQLEIDDLSGEGERATPVAFPCALIDLADVVFTDDSSGRQQAEGVLEVRVALTAYTAATHYYKDNHKKNALAYYNIEHRVTKALHNWGNDMYFNELSRISVKTERRQDNLRVRVIRFSFGYTDYTNMVIPAQTIARPDLDLQTKF